MGQVKIAGPTRGSHKYRGSQKWDRFKLQVLLGGHIKGTGQNCRSYLGSHEWDRLKLQVQLGGLTNGTG